MQRFDFSYDFNKKKMIVIYKNNLLVENKDLKEFLKEKGLIDENGQVIDNE